MQKLAVPFIWLRQIILGLLVVLFLYSIYLAATRIYQVDEAQNLFMARILGTGQSLSYFTNAPLWLMGPLAWLARSAQESQALFGWARAFGLVVFWGNVVLIGINTGLPLRSLRWLLALLAAATLAPLWDYGFEFRHDNLILMGLLVSWWTWRHRPASLPRYALLGFLAVIMQFIAFKAFVFAVPLTALAFLFPHPAHRHGRFRLAAAWCAGALAAFLLCRLAYQAAGLWPVYLRGLHGGMEASAAGSRFSPGLALGRLLTQTPLLLALSAAALFEAAWRFRSGWRTAWTQEGTLPEALFLLAMVGALLINPTPFPYNLVNLVPFALLLGVRFLAPLVQEGGSTSAGLALATGLFCFTHAVPFATASLRHLDWPNDRQELLMRTAEAMTDPARDSVYDAIGMVPTRPSIHFRWYLHSLNIQSFLDGKDQSVRQIMAANPPAVFISSYRMAWLQEDDWKYIRSCYLPLADDFWVLGQVLPPGGGPATILHAGRYLIMEEEQAGRLVPLRAATLDGSPLEGQALHLAQGPHQVRCAPATRPVLLWVGPHLERLPQLSPGDHLHLFMNWY